MRMVSEDSHACFVFKAGIPVSGLSKNSLFLSPVSHHGKKASFVCLAHMWVSDGVIFQVSSSFLFVHYHIYICIYQKQVALQAVFTCIIFSCQNISYALENVFSVLQSSTASARDFDEIKETQIKKQTIKREAIQTNGLVEFFHMAPLTLI